MDFLQGKAVHCGCTERPKQLTSRGCTPLKLLLGVGIIRDSAGGLVCILGFLGQYEHGAVGSPFQRTVLQYITIQVPDFVPVITIGIQKNIFDLDNSIPDKHAHEQIACDPVGLIRLIHVQENPGILRYMHKVAGLMRGKLFRLLFVRGFIRRLFIRDSLRLFGRFVCRLFCRLFRRFICRSLSRFFCRLIGWDNVIWVISRFFCRLLGGFLHRLVRGILSRFLNGSFHGFLCRLLCGILRRFFRHFLCRFVDDLFIRCFFCAFRPIRRLNQQTVAIFVQRHYLFGFDGLRLVIWLDVIFVIILRDRFFLQIFCDELDFSFVFHNDGKTGITLQPVLRVFRFSQGNGYRSGEHQGQRKNQGKNTFYFHMLVCSSHCSTPITSNRPWTPPKLRSQVIRVIMLSVSDTSIPVS